MFISYEDIIINSENEKRILQYISEVNNTAIRKGILILSREMNIDINDHINNLNIIDVELMVFVGVLEVLTSKKICSRYAKAFNASVLKVYDAEIIRNKIIKDLCLKLNVTNDFLISLLHQFYPYAERFEYIKESIEEDKVDLFDEQPKEEYINNEYNTGRSQPKQRRSYLFILIGVILLTISVFRAVPSPQITTMVQGSDENILQVRGLTLKYILVSTAAEIYDANVRISEDQSFYYKYYGNDMYNHYKWMRQTYKDMPDEMKNYLYVLYNNGSNEGNYICLLTSLGDEAGIDQIINRIKVSYIPKESKIAAEKFYPYFYENYLKEHIESNKERFDAYALELNQEIQLERPDLLGFIEESSGVQYGRAYKPILYYTMRPENALSFTYKNTYITLLPSTRNKYSDLFYIPYHEYSHGIFRTITRTKEFKEIAIRLKNDSKMYNAWNNDYYNHYYTWEEWCEDNLVEGFAMYLEYKANGKETSRMNSIRPYDKEFFNYLVKNQFDPNNIELKTITMEFLEEVAR